MPQERQVENTIPKHVPLDVKLTKAKEKNWKDLKNENWARDFEVEVTNTEDKPIYTFGSAFHNKMSSGARPYLINKSAFCFVASRSAASACVVATGSWLRRVLVAGP